MQAKLQEFLDQNRVDYDLISHSPAYTAQEIAARCHIPGQDLAKTVIVKLDGKLTMLVGPAHLQFDLEALKQLTKAKKVELARESEFEDRFKDCEVGAMPPFGNLWNMDVFVDDSLLQDEEISFNAGNHSELVKMKYSDWASLVKPKVVHIH